jgi:NADPH-dependent glutamate synthase beta subunit-like oxidoreductase
MGEEGFDTVFIGTGAGSPQFMGIPANTGMACIPRMNF